MNQDRLAAALIESALDAVIVMNQDGRVVQEGFMVTLVECLLAARIVEADPG